MAGCALVGFVVAMGFHRQAVGEQVLNQLSTSLEGDARSKAITQLLGCASISEAVILSTCERVEFYVVADRFHSCVSELREFVASFSEISLEQFVETAAVAFDEDAVIHLFRTAAGLRSSVLGEVEILGQIRQAWEFARAEGATSILLDTMFSSALAVGRRARSQTAIAQGSTSLAHVALEMALERMPERRRLTALVIGAGQMGEAVVRALAKTDAINDVLVANRTAGRARALAMPYATVRAVPYNDLATLVGNADIVISAAPTVLVSVDDSSHRDKPVLLIDLAVQQSFPDSLLRRDNVDVINLEAITQRAQESQDLRSDAIHDVEAHVATSVDAFFHGLDERDVVPLLSAMYERGESIRVAELTRFASKLAALDPVTRNTVEGLTKAIVAKLLHEPATQLKDRAGTEHGRRLAAELRKAFDL